MHLRRRLRRMQTAACLIAPTVAFVVLVLWVSQVRAYLSATTYQERALQQIIQAAIEGNEQFVADDSTTPFARPRTAISQPAWQVLASHSKELPDAITSITTTANQGDIVKSEIRISMPVTTLQCHSADGDVIFTSFYVYTCTIVTGSSP